MNPLKELGEQRQSIWLDYIRRNLIRSGELKRMVDEDGIRGVTSNPTIFEKAIAGSTDYDDALREMLASDGNADVEKLYEPLAIEDIQMAADVLRPVYDATNGDDGYVSLEVSPHLAHDTQRTISEAKRLRAAVDRPNLMVKVPATSAGIPAIEQLIADGLSINVTLMFSMAHYEAGGARLCERLGTVRDAGQRRLGGVVLRQPGRHRGRQRIGKKWHGGSESATRQDRHRQFQSRLSPLHGNLSR
jgi:transaldolase